MSKKKTRKLVGWRVKSAECGTYIRPPVSYWFWSRIASDATLPTFSEALRLVRSAGRFHARSPSPCDWHPSELRIVRVYRRKGSKRRKAVSK